jgi:hypothetical protein
MRIGLRDDDNEYRFIEKDGDALLVLEVKGRIGLRIKGWPIALAEPSLDTLRERRLDSLAGGKNRAG